MNWIKKLFSETEGAFVAVDLDYGFGPVPTPGHKGATKGPYPHTLHIIDLSPELAKKALHGKRFDWHAGKAGDLAPFSHWRHNLEIGGFHAAPWDEVKMYLRDA